MVDKLEISFATPLRLIVEDSESSEGFALVTIRHQQFEVTAKGEDIMYTLPVDHLVTMKVSYVDAAGNPAKVDGAVVWASSDDDVVAVDIDPKDSSICTVTPVGAVGQVQVTATADADLGAGVRQIITTCDIEIVAGEAVAGTISPVGTPQPIAPHPEPQT